MAYKFQIGAAILSGTMEVEETLNAAGGFELAGTAVTATAAELNVLDGLAQGAILLGDGDGAATTLDVSTSGQILVGNGTTAVSVAVSGDIGLATDGTMTIQANAVEDSMINDNVATGLAGDGLGALNGVLSVQVSGAIALNNDKVGLSGSIASDGLKYLGGVDSISSLEVDLNNLVAGSVDVGNDSIAIVDASDNLTKKESITDLVTAIAGSGLSAANGVISVQGDAVHLLSDQNMNLSGGINVYSGAAPTASRAYTLPTGSSLTSGNVIRVKAGNLAQNSVTASIQCQGTDNIDGTLTQIDLESPSAAVTIIYAGAGNFVIF